MFIPLVAYIEISNRIRIYTYYFFLLLFTQSFIPYLIVLIGKNIIYIYKINVGYLVYIFAGYIIHNHKFSRLTKIIIYLAGIFSILIHLIGTNILTFKYNRIIQIHRGYLNLPAIFHSCALFLFIKENSYIIFKILDKNLINRIGSLTLGPFFLHLVIRETIDKFFKFDIFINYSLLLSSFVVFFICILLSAILKKIPLLNLLVP